MYIYFFRRCDGLNFLSNLRVSKDILAIKVMRDNRDHEVYLELLDQMAIRAEKE